MYNYFVLCKMDYVVGTWGGSYDSNVILKQLERIHIAAMWLLLGETAFSDIAKLCEELS